MTRFYESPANSRISFEKPHKVLQIYSKVKFDASELLEFK